jgi:hypothetical protein
VNVDEYTYRGLALHQTMVTTGPQEDRTHVPGSNVSVDHADRLICQPTRDVNERGLDEAMDSSRNGIEDCIPEQCLAMKNLLGPPEPVLPIVSILHISGMRSPVKGGS